MKKRSMRNRISLKPTMKFAHRLLLTAGFGMIILTASLIAYFNIGTSTTALAVVNGDYRSFTSGNWNNIATWEKYNGVSWIPAIAAPTSLDGVITIQNGHTVAVTAAVTADQVVVDAGGILNVNTGTLTLANGAGTDLTVNGTLNISSPLTLSASVNIDVNNIATLKPTGTLNFNLGSFINVNGRFRRTGGVMSTTASFWSINNGGTFEHAINGGSLLTSASWKVGSTCDVTGITTAVPVNITQVFHHFIWNCPNQIAGFNFNAKFDFVNGNLTIISTGASTLQFDYQGNNNTTNIGGNVYIQGGTSYGCANGSALFNIGGDYVQTGGTFAFNQSWAASYGNTSTTLNIAGNLVMTGGIMDMTQSTANNPAIGKGHIDIMGNINLSGTALLTETSAESHGEIVFIGTAIQTYNLNNLVTNKIDYIVNSGAIVRTGLNLLTSDGIFTLMAAGHLMIGSPDGITQTNMLGNVRVTGTRTYSTGGYYTYEGASAQVSGDGLPSQVANLTLNNANNCTLTNSSSVSGILTFTTGLWIATTDTLTLGISTGTRGTLSRVTGHVVGYFGRWLTTSIVNNILFPVGTLNYYNGANFSFTTAPTSGGSIVSTFIPQNPGKLGLPQMDGAVNCDGIGYGFWSFGPFNGFTGGAYAVNLYANGFFGVTDYTSLHICRRNAALIPWSFNGTHTPGTGSNAAPVANRLAKTILGHYGITSGGPNPLPVKLISFKAVLENNIVNLSWVTASEINNDYFNVERSTDGKSFVSIIKVKGAGSTSVLHQYKATDAPVSGTYYYRLKQTDFNGQFSYSDIEAVHREENSLSENSLAIKSISPNPFSTEFRANFNATSDRQLTVEMISYGGKLISREIISSSAGKNEYVFHAKNDLQAGIYFLRISNEKETATAKAIKR